MLIFNHKYISHWKNKIKNNNKLSFYSSLKDNYQPESYFNVLQNKEIRKQLTKFRISNHKLMIETGRYQHSKIPADVRFCPVCATSEIENEEHFLLLKLQKYEHVRKKFLGEIKLVTNLKKHLNNDSFPQFFFSFSFSFFYFSSLSLLFFTFLLLSFSPIQLYLKKTEIISTESLSIRSWGKGGENNSRIKIRSEKNT